MSEQNTTALPSPKFEVLSFEEGDAKGFKFNVPNYDKVTDYVAVYGEDVVASIVAAAIAARIRTKVKNDLGLKDVKPHEVQAHIAKKLASTGGILFSETDAKNWRPDVREVSSKQMFKRAVEMLNKEYPVLLAQGKTTEATAKMIEAQDLMKRASERAMREAEEAATDAAQQTTAPASPA